MSSGDARINPTRTQRVLLSYRSDHDADKVDFIQSVIEVDEAAAQAAAQAKTRRFLSSMRHETAHIMLESLELVSPAVTVTSSAWDRHIDLVPKLPERVSVPLSVTSCSMGTGKTMLAGLRIAAMVQQETDPLRQRGAEAERKGQEPVGRRLTEVERKLQSSTFLERFFYSSSTDVFQQDRREVKIAALWRLTSKVNGKRLFRFLRRRIQICLLRRSGDAKKPRSVAQDIDGIGLDHSCESHRSRAPALPWALGRSVQRELVPI